MSDISDMHGPSKRKRVGINLDADPQNANWLRILEREREQGKQPKQETTDKETHDNG